MSGAGRVRINKIKKLTVKYGLGIRKPTTDVTEYAYERQRGSHWLHLETVFGGGLCLEWIRLFVSILYVSTRVQSEKQNQQEIHIEIYYIMLNKITQMPKDKYFLITFTCKCITLLYYMTIVKLIGQNVEEKLAEAG